MDSIRKWFYRPKKEDKSLLAQFFYADESLNGVACELDSFDGRQEPERCASLVNQMRHCQDKVLSICNQIMDELIPDSRANRDFRVKFPDDVMQENLAGQLWFGAECLAAGSSILNREAESSAMRPLAKALTKSLEIVRNLLREQALKGQTNLKAQNPLEPAVEKLIESLKIFDRLFADFELCYVGAMVPVKSTKEYEQQELVCVLFSETLQRALERGLLRQADVDNYEPALMFTIPRLAIVAGLLAPPGGPLCLDSSFLDSISEMFRPFRSLLLKIRELLWTLNSRELYMLEKLLCSLEEASPASTTSTTTHQQQSAPLPDLDDFVHNFYTGYPNCKDFIADFYTVTRNNGSNMDEVANDAVLILAEQPETSGAAPTQRHDSSGSSDFYSCDSVSVEIPVNQFSQPENNCNCTTTAVTTTNPDSSSSRGSMAHSTSTTDPAKLISDTNKSLSNLLLETDCRNEMSEQTDSGICTVISSENTSLYEKSPEEKKSFANKLEQGTQTNNDTANSSIHSPEDLNGNKDELKNQNEPDGQEEAEEEEEEDKEEGENEDEKEEEEEGNTSYLCSNVFNSPKRRDLNKSDNSTSCVCSTRASRANSTYLMNSFEAVKQITVGSSEEIVGIALGSGQIPVCDVNQPNFQINYTDNWENLNLNIESSSSHREFWSDLKCEACPAVLQKTAGINRHQQQLHQHHHQERLASRKRKEEKQKRRRRKAEYMTEEAQAQQQQQQQQCTIENAKRRFAYRTTLQLPTSTESSRSNSTDRCLNPRLVNFGSSLHPSQNTRQMPNFGACSPRASPRMQHFESRTSSNTRRQQQLQQQQQQHHHHHHHRHHHHLYQHNQRNTYMPPNYSLQSKKLLEHRRQRSGEHLQSRFKKSSRRTGIGHKLEHLKKKNNNNSDKYHSNRAKSDLIDDGLGPRTNKSGIVTNERNVTCVYTNMTMESESCKSVALQNKQLKTVDASTSPNAIRNDQTSSSSCSICWDSSSETSEFQSDCQDDEEIALAMQAAEIANRNQIRAKFRSSEDLVHRLFVCIAGVADQLQTNFASDLRNILKCVFLMNSSQPVNEDEVLAEPSSTDPGTETNMSERTANNVQVDQEHQEQHQHTIENEVVSEEHEPDNNTVTACPVTERGEECVERAPVWVPDSVAPRCMACQAGFTVVRRRHHCRNCGKVFCGRCSSNNVPLPRFGHTKPVRVCNRCFLYQVTPFTVSQVAASTS